MQVYSSTAVASCNLTGSRLVAALNNTTTWTMSPTSKLHRCRETSTWYKSGWRGSHEFQTGFFLQPNSRNRNDVVYPNGGANLEDAVLKNKADASAGYTVFHKRVFGVESATTSSVKAQDYALYVQDTWKPVSQLSLSLGVRADKVITQDMIFDKTIESAWNVGPRLGATYQVTKDERTSCGAATASSTTCPSRS